MTIWWKTGQSLYLDNQIADKHTDTYIFKYR